ncbi:MAG: NAD synthetase [Gimesia sp.]|nr:NAD synthetase [Gimesia sp.]
MHWVSDKEPDLTQFGFVYIITNLKNKKSYIGCKQYFNYRKKKKKSESNWKSYMGSSKPLLEDIKKIGKKNFQFEIIGEFKNKRSLRYYECYYQMKLHVLTATLEGTDEPAYYNNYIGGKFYRPVEEHHDSFF